MEDKSLLKELKEHPGWKVLESYIKDQQLLFASKLMKIDPTDVSSIANFQGQIQAFDKIITKINKS